MNHTPQTPSTTGPALSRTVVSHAPVCRSAVRRTLRVLGPLVIAVPVSLVLGLAGAAADWMGAVWLAAVFWAIAASFVQALRQGLRHGDWSAFVYVEVPRNDEEFDFFTRTGRYSYRRDQADDEALMREDDRFLKNHDQDHSLL